MVINLDILTPVKQITQTIFLAFPIGRIQRERDLLNPEGLTLIFAYSRTVFQLRHWFSLMAWAVLLVGQRLMQSWRRS